MCPSIVWRFGSESGPAASKINFRKALLRPLCETLSSVSSVAHQRIAGPIGTLSCSTDVTAYRQHDREVIDMSELDPEHRLPYFGATVVDVVASDLDGELICGPMAPAGSPSS